MTDNCEQQELQLFIPPEFGELITKKNITNLEIIFNSRLARSWRVKINRFSGRRILTIPSYFKDADEPVKSAMIEWALLFPTRKNFRNKAYKSKKREIENILWQYIESCQRGYKKTLKKSLNFNSSGLVYDLKEVFNTINNAYFGGTLVSFIRWNKSMRRSYQTSFTDKNGSVSNLVSIAQIYNRRDVPRFAIESIVYHEMLHIAIPPIRNDLRNIIHGREFKTAEKSFPYYHEWKKWEKEQFINNKKNN
jgi:hypothetical protein